MYLKSIPLKYVNLKSTLLLFLFFFIPLCTANGENSTPNSRGVMMADHIYLVEAKIDGCKAELYLNDIPLVLLAGDTDPSISIPVNQYIISGKNTLSIVINPGPIPSLARTYTKEGISSNGIAINASLSRYKKGTFPGDPSALKIISLTWEGKQDQQINVPLELQEYGNITASGNWLWESAPKLQLNERTKTQIFSILSHIHDGLANHNYQPRVNVSMHMYTELAAAYGVDPSEYIDNKISKFRNNIEHDDKWGMKPFNVDLIDLRLVANGRMIEAIGKDWKGALRTVKTQKSGQSFYTFKFSLIKDQLQIIR